MEPVSTPVPSFENEAVQDLFDQHPIWLVRWGTTLLFGLVGLLVVVSFFVRYPDLVQVPFRLTSSNAPKPIVAKTDGRLVRLLVPNNAIVTSGQPLAFLESTADASAISQLYTWLLNLRQNVQQGAPGALLAQLPPSTQFGELQANYASFLQAQATYQNFQANGFYQRQRTVIQQELAELKASAENLRAQQNLYRRDVELAKQKYDLNKELYQQKVIALADLRQEESQRLAKELPLKQAEYALHLNASAQFDKTKELLDIERLSAAQASEFNQALNLLISRVETWQARYVLSAPTAGQLRFGSFLQVGQFIRARQDVFYLSGPTQDEFGEVRLPQQNFGKVRLSQKVLIRFASYPAAEFGVVLGKVTFISAVPNPDGTFLAKIDLPHGLHTTYGRVLEYRTGMTANAEIVTDDSRLLLKIFARLEKILRQ